MKLGIGFIEDHNMIRNLIVLLCTLSMFGRPGVALPTLPDCPGCNGTGGMGTGGMGCSITVSVVVTDGMCRWVEETEPRGTFCRQSKKCSAEVSATWSGLPPNESFEGCATIAGVRYCVDPPPSTGTGSGSGVYYQPLNCVQDNPVDFSLSFSGCGSATATALCSECGSE